MPSNEKQLLEKALGLSLAEVGLDWPQFQKDYGIRHDDPADEAADRAFFTWQRFRGEHRANSCLLDDEGRVRGLIIKSTGERRLRLPELPALEYLCVCENKQLEEIELAGQAYPLLQYVDWSNNALKRAEIAVELPLLKYLSLRNNRVTRFKIAPPRELSKLEELDLSYNYIKNWDAFVADKLPALAYLFLYENPLNESVTTYREEGEDNNYLRSLQALRKSFGEAAPVKNDTYKVLVVGDGKAGKSCMVERLVRNRFLDTWDSTHGISVEHFVDENKRYGFPYKLNLWDFGGQDIYHHTHRMFLQANATYILLWNAETEYQDKIVQPIGNKKHHWENKKVPYWLDYIRYLGQGSPVVVAQTHSLPADKRDPHPNEAGLLQAYREVLPYVSEFLHLDAEEEDAKRSGYKRLLQEVEEAIDRLDRDEYLPAHWHPIRKRLEDMTPREAATDKTAFMGMERNTLELQEFLEMVPSHEPEPMKLLTNWLVPTGVVFYKEGLFDNKIILNQGWAIRAVYALYDRSETGYYFELKESKGHFDGAMLNQCWKDYTEAERSWFLEFMLKAELCFEITPAQRNASWAERQFVAVEMLPADRPGGLSIQERNWQSQGTALCQLRYRYPFLHAGIIQSFIARTHHFAAIEDIYKQGMVVTVEGHPVLIEAQPDPQGSRGDILVTLPTDGVDVLHRIRKEFEGIHKGREHEEAVRPADGEWVSWEVLEAKSHDTHLPTAEGNSAVPSGPYRVFLLDEKRREVLALSESPLPAPKVGTDTSVPSPPASSEPKGPEPHLNWQAHIRSLLRKNEIEQALTVLSKHLPEHSASLERRYAAIKNRRLKGTISNDDYLSRENQIAEDLLSLIRDDKPVSPLKPSFMKTYSKWLIGLAIGCILILLGLDKTGVIKIPGFEFGVTSKTPTEEASSLSTATVIGSVYLNGKPAKSSEVVEVKVKGVNTVNPTSLAGNQFTLRNVPLPSDSRLEIALVFPDNIEEARVFNIGGPKDGVVDIGELRVQLEAPAAGSGSTPRITIVNKNIIQSSNNINSEGSGNQDADN